MKRILYLYLGLIVFAPLTVHAQSFTDVTSKTYEYTAITDAIKNGWIKPLSDTSFGYGATITPQDWLFMLMFFRTADACPELGMTPNQYWTTDNIKYCLAGTGVPTATESATTIRRDEAMQQLFALRRKSYAYQQLETKPAGYVDPTDLASIPADRQGAMIAADRLKLLFRSKGALLPSAPLLREDAVLSVWRFHEWERQGGVDAETHDQTTLASNTTLDHWRDLDTDIYVVKVKSGGDAYIHPILPYRSYNPAPASSKTTVRDEFVYEKVSDLAKESGAIAAVNGSYFNVQWPWGALEDVAVVNGKTIYQRTDRSTFVVCVDGSMFIGTYTKANLKAIKCTAEQALGAGPLFMQNGDVLEQNTKEGIDEYTQWQRRVGSDARTAIAVSKNRKTAYIITVAGKSYPAFGKGGNTLGAFLLSKYPDMGNAMMFDGGGSSALYAKGSLLVGAGVSGGTAERAVVSALGVFSKKTDKLALASFEKAKAKRWDPVVTQIKITKPTKSFAWLTIAQAKKNGFQIATASSRATKIQIADATDKVQTYNVTFDLVAQDAATSSKLIVTRRQGTHERGWNIPTELHVINPKDGSDVDVIKLFSYLPDAQKPDLKTFDVLAFRPSGVIFGDATGRVWFYYAKDQQLSPGKFKVRKL
ncbi:MAG: phosphodiester glycosidase family protein [Patescibacteria group bacterium]